MHQEKIALRQGKAYLTSFIHEKSQNRAADAEEAGGHCRSWRRIRCARG